MLARTTLSLLLLCGLVAATGCDGCAEKPSGTDDDGRNTLPPNSNPGDDDDDDEEPAPEARDLAFSGVSPIDVFYGQQVQLPFTLTTRSGVKVTGEDVAFTLEGEGGTLNVAQATTDGSGVARVTFTAGTADATVTVRASAELADDVTVSVRVKVNPVGSLKVAVSSQTRIPVTRAEVLVFRGPAQNTPTCAYLDTATTVPTATFAAEFAAVPANRTFTDQPHGQAVTVLASGYNSAGDLIATGCSDGSGIIGGTTTTVTVSMRQLPSVLAGDYDVLMEVDLGQALPEPYEGYVDTVTAVLSDPAGYAIYQAFKAYDPEWWYDDLGDGYREHSYREVSENPQDWTSFATAQPILDDLLRDQLGPNYVTVTTVGGDIRGAITSFEVGTRFGIEPGVAEDVYNVSEQWNDLVFTWSLGCPDGDVGCARRPITLDDPAYAPAETEYAAVATHAPLSDQSERFQVVSDPHQFALKYGAIVMIAMNEVVFPSLPYQANQGEEPAHSLGEVLHNLIECEDVGYAIEEASGGWVSASTGESACILGLNGAGNYLENYVLSLSVGGDDPDLSPKEQTGALGGGTFYLVDQNKDLATELVRELEMHVQWNDAEDGASTDIFAPIVGEGREAADGCDADAACEAGTFCQPVAHYLKVKDVEMTCKKPVGDALGEEPCSADNECATGICVGDSTGVPGTCFAACATDDACGLGSCTDAAAFLDLDTVLDGLGDASLSSCMVP